MPPFTQSLRSISNIRQALTMGEVAISEILTDCETAIQQLDRTGPTLNSILALAPDRQDQARALERQGPGPNQPLFGAPILIKDNLVAAGALPTTGGSLALAEWRPNEDAPAVAGLRAAGALVFGKTNLSEWANFRSSHSTSGWSSVGGQTRNPHVLNRDPSGSSSGSAVAVSAGLCVGAVGTETDGSITSPASCSGIVGIKPTVGLVSRRGIIPISHRQDTAGPMARSVADAALMLSAMAGPDPDDPATERIPAGFDLQLERNLGAADLTGLRIGAMASPSWLLPPVEPIYASALALLRQLGVQLVDGLAVEVDGWGPQELLALKTEFRMGLEQFLAGQQVEPPFRTLAALIDFNRRHADVVMPLFGQDLLLAAAKTDPADPAYAEAVEDLARLCRDEYLLQLLDGHDLDVLVAPTSNPTTLVDYVHGSRAKGGSFISPAAVAGFPHATVPMGRVQHLPVGLSFVGRPFSEPTLLRVADCFERSLDLSIEPKFIATLEV